MRRFPVGAFPAMGLSAARDAARVLHMKVRGEGADPVAERRRARAASRDAKAGIGTLTALLDRYATKHGVTLKSWPECRQRINGVFAKHLARPLAALKATDLQDTADDWPSAQSAAAAVRYLRPVLKWAAQRGQVPAALAAVAPPATVGRRTRVLSRDELATLLPTLRRSERPYAAAMTFMLLTLARREEVARARWRDVDLSASTWAIVETKNGQPHVVPLSRQLVALLSARRPVNARPDELVFTTGGGGPLGNWDRETKMLQEASGTADWTRHDLRRTGATLLGDMGELPDIIEAALNHVAIRSQLAATYNRSRYRPQVAAALQRLADALDGIEHGGAAIIPLRSVATG